MNREQHLKYCKKCTNQELNFQTGLICKLTGEKANFELECNDFILDPNYVEKLDDIDAVEHSEVISKLSDENIEIFKSEQNYSNAVIAGVVTGIIGAILWGVISVLTGYQIGYMAIAIGAGVGFSMRYFGKGIDQVFGITGGLIAILSCLFGNFFSIIGYIANNESLGYIETFTMFNYGELIPIMTSTFSPMDLLFYAIAGYQGYKFSFRAFTEKDLHEVE